MKIFITPLITLVLALTTAFTPNINPMDDVVDALKKGNVTAIATYFDDMVEIALPDKSDSYNKSQATVVLKDFFTNNPVKNFVIEHKGNNGGSEFCIGTLQTQKNNYRLTVYLKQRGSLVTLQEIRIEQKK